MKKIELLVPAGNMEALLAAINNGADAIYLGIKNFGARAFANNFDHIEIIEALKLAHLNGVKIYVTMNTMLNENEIENALKEVEFLYDHGVDAIIVQDLGLMSECHKRFPNLELHASTQMHIHNQSSAEFIISKGIKRVVLARETTLQNVKKISDLGIETEIFAHGALCISYSGQCLMSSVLFNRSGNKGMCAQCCRLQYKLHDDDNDSYIKSDDEYLLSPKDLNLLEKIPLLIEANVSSIKIEGRMKRAQYVGLVTRLYREAIDAYYDHRTFKVDANMIKSLKVMFNRGFTDGHLLNASSKDIYNQARPNHLGIEVGKVIKYYNKQVFIKLSEDIAQTDGLRIIDNNQEYGIVANRIYKDGLLTNKGLKSEIVAFDFDNFINKNSIVLKTTDTKLNKTIDNLDIYRKVNISMSFKAMIGEPFKLRVDDGQNMVDIASSFILEEAKKAPVTKDKIIELLTRINDTVFKVNKIDGNMQNIFVPIKVISELRRNAIEELSKIRENKKYDNIKNNSYNLLNNHNILDNIIIEINNDEQYRLLKNIKAIIMTSDFDLAFKYHLYYLTNNVNEDSIYNKYDLNVASELGILNNSTITSANLNIANSYALEFILNNNIDGVILSSELNNEQIINLINSYYQRYNYYPNVYRHIYGKRDLMYLKKSFIDKNINSNIDQNHHYSLVDTKNRSFKIYQNEGITHILESESILNDKIDHCGIYIRFTDETNKDIKDILKELNIAF